MHVITALPVGGAEMALARLVNAFSPAGVESSVVALGPDGPVGEQLRDAGIPVTALGARRPLDVPRVASQLLRTLRTQRPDVVQTWLYHSDVLGGLLARITRTPAVVWSLRSSDLDPSAFKRRTIAVARAEALLSRRVPDAIICGSNAALTFHQELGFRAPIMRVIPNGLDLTAGPTSDPTDVRHALRIPATAPVIIRVGRLHPHKDYPGFFAALSELAPRYPDLHVIVCGEGLEDANPEVTALAARTGMSDRIRLLGRRSDVEQLAAVADVACSSSIGEGFPNVVAESMAVGVPAVVTDVGDSAFVVGDTGVVVPPRNPAALATGLDRLLSLTDVERRVLGSAARARIAENFTVERMAAEHESLYRELLDRTGRTRPPARQGPRPQGA